MKKFLSIILCVLILCATFPLSVLADEIGYDTVSEAVELREENVKHFLNPDGSYTALAYSKPVHRLDENGNWQDLENIMNEETRGNKQAYITSDGRTVFSKKINSTDNEIFTLNEGKYEISVSFVNEGLKNTTAKLSNHAKKYTPSKFDKLETQYKKLKEIDTTTTLLYKNALSGVDLEYVLSVNDIKENIIVRKLQDEYSYSFIYELNGLIPELNDDGSISLKDKETLDTIYSMPAPFMVDNSGEASQDVEYILTDKGNDTYEITAHANAEWINSPERELPVVIDPTTVSMGRCEDTYVGPNLMNRPYGNETTIYLDSSNVAFMKPNMPELPNDATITQAILNLYYYFPSGSWTENISVVRVFPMTVDWDEDTLTWYLANSYQNMGIDYNGVLNAVVCPNYSEISSSSPGVASTDITYLYQNAYAGKPYYGFAMDLCSGDATIILTSENLYTYSYCEITYNRDALVENDIYFLPNAMNPNKYMFVSDNYLHIVNQLNYLDNERWAFEYLHNGYYKITNTRHDMQLCVSENTQNSNGASFDLDEYQPTPYYQWKITETSAGSGIYKISPRSNESMFISLSDDGSTFLQRTVQSDLKDEWIFRKSDILKTIWFNESNVTVDRSEYVNDTAKAFVDMDEPEGVISCAISAEYPETREKAISLMKGSDMIIIHTHGQSGGTGFLVDDDGNNDKTANDPVFVTMQDIAVENFENLDFVLLLVCQSGANYDPFHIENNTPVNIVEQLVLSGVETVVGFTGDVLVDDCNKFAVDLISKMAIEGRSVQNAINVINNEYNQEDKTSIMEKIVVAGNPDYRFSGYE